MAEELQSLLDRIQKDGVDKADAEARRIVEDARKQAQRIVTEAEARAESLLAKAEADGQAFAERGRVALEQAARDVVISVGDAVNRTLEQLVHAELKDALDGETVARMLVKLAEAYGAGAGGTRRIEALVPADQRQAIVERFQAKFADAARGGVDIKGDDAIVRGFRVSVTGESVEHDFSESAIAAALCELLRPHIGAIVKKALQG